VYIPIVLYCTLSLLHKFNKLVGRIYAFETAPYLATFTVVVSTGWT